MPGRGVKKSKLERGNSNQVEVTTGGKRVLTSLHYCRRSKSRQSRCKKTKNECREKEGKSKPRMIPCQGKGGTKNWKKDQGVFGA